RSGWSTTAAATTGPARQPRPTSSTPATYMKPARRSGFSSVRMAGTRVTVYVPGLRCQFCVLRFSFRPPALFHPRRLALEVAQIIQLSAPHLRRPHHLDLLDRRRVERENPLDALAERHFAHRKGPARPAAMHPDDDALEDLDALLVAFAHFHVHADGVARLHRRPVGQLRLLDHVDTAGTHHLTPSRAERRARAESLALLRPTRRRPGDPAA